MIFLRTGKSRTYCGRVLRDAWLNGNLENWREAQTAEWQHAPRNHIRLRNGVVLDSPDTIELAFLFQETGLRRVYSPPGYKIKSGATVIDIGANIGVLAIYAAYRTPGVKVFCYEPFPESVKWLRNNIRKSELTNVHVHHQAVSGGTCVRYLQVDADNWIVHSLRGEGSATQSGLAVDGVSFDEITNKENIDCCDRLKVDREGSEYEILASLRSK